MAVDMYECLLGNYSEWASDHVTDPWKSLLKKT